MYFCGTKFHNYRQSQNINNKTHKIKKYTQGAYFTPKDNNQQALTVTDKNQINNRITSKQQRIKKQDCKIDPSKCQYVTLLN